MAYYRLEPFGEARADLRHGILTALLANINRDTKRRKKPYGPEDFIPEYGKEYEEPEVMTPEETFEVAKRLFESLAAGMGTKVNMPEELKKADG